MTLVNSVTNFFVTYQNEIAKALLALLLILVVICIIIRVLSSSRPVIVRHEEEYYFEDPISGTKRRFPSPDDDFELYLSVVIPAYNEQKRLPKMLDEAIQYLEDRCYRHNAFSYEIIVVDDGSRDGTTEVAQSYVRRLGTEKMRTLTLQQNRGKGGAVRLGMLSARGTLLLFADADGATRFADFEKLENFIKSSSDYSSVIAIGSRAHLQNEAVATRSFFRTILMYGFHFLVWFLTVRTIKDTQCGFKLFERNIAHVLFTSIHVERWAFDVELLLIAEQLKCRIGEIAVNWTEIEGSKIVPIWSWLQMGKDLAIISFQYTIGAWAIPSLKTN